MPSNAPPDGWLEESGEWGVDIDRDETLFITGTSSIKFSDTTPASDPVLASESTAGEVEDALNTTYVGQATIRADRNNAGDDVDVRIELSSDRLFSSSSFVFLTKSLRLVGPTPVDAIDTWQHIGERFKLLPAFGGNWLRMALTKANVNFNSFVDRSFLKKTPASWIDFDTISVGTGAFPTFFPLLRTSGLLGDNDLNQVSTVPGNSSIKIARAGFYLLSAVANFLIGGSGADIAIRFEIEQEGSPVAFVPIDNTTFFHRTSGQNLGTTITISTVVFLTPQNEVRLVAAHDRGSPEDVEFRFTGINSLTF